MMERGWFHLFKEKLMGRKSRRASVFLLLACGKVLTRNAFKQAGTYLKPSVSKSP